MSTVYGLLMAGFDVAVMGILYFMVKSHSFWFSPDPLVCTRPMTLSIAYGRDSSLLRRQCGAYARSSAVLSLLSWVVYMLLYLGAVTTGDVHNYPPSSPIFNRKD